MERTTSAPTLPAGSLRAPEFLRALRSTATVLEDHAAALDRLDAVETWDVEVAGSGGDGGGSAPSNGPGSDLARTLRQACAACGDAADFPSICSALADGSAGAASTVAGRRLARFLAGSGAALRNADRVDGLNMALALEAGAERLAAADDGSHPGGLPAVVAASADAALAAADGGSDLGEVLVSAADAGLAELEQGPLVDPRLAERGTVDATAAGFLLILDSLASVVTGDPLPAPPRDQPALPAPGSGHRYRIQGRVTPPAADPAAAADLEVVLHELGDRVDFRASGPAWSVDLVTAHPGAAVEAMAGAGTPTELHIAVVDDPPGDVSVTAGVRR